MPPIGEIGEGAEGRNKIYNRMMGISWIRTPGDFTQATKAMISDLGFGIVDRTNASVFTS